MKESQWQGDVNQRMESIDWHFVSLTSQKLNVSNKKHVLPELSLHFFLADYLLRKNSFIIQIISLIFNAKKKKNDAHKKLLTVFSARCEELTAAQTDTSNQ